MASVKQIEANRLNGKKAKGKKTIWGKIKSSKNALKHGLLGDHVLIIGENKHEYEEFKQGLIEFYDPKNQLQEEIVFQRISLQWRIRRATRIEAGVFSSEAVDASVIIGRDFNKKSKIYVDEFKGSDVSSVPKQIEVPANGFVRDNNGAHAILNINRIEANLSNRFYSLLERYKKMKEEEDA